MGAPTREPSVKDRAVDADGADQAKSSRVDEEAAHPSDGPDSARDLETEYDVLQNAFDNLYRTRAIGVREVLGNLNEKDKPSLGEELMMNLSRAALSFAGQFLASGLTQDVDGAVGQGARSALKDGSTGEAAAIEARVRGGGGAGSKATFFAAQEAGLSVTQEFIGNSVARAKGTALEALDSAPADQRETLLKTKVEKTRNVREKIQHKAEEAQDVQYQKSLAQWMVALARSELGVDSIVPEHLLPDDAKKTHGGTDLDDATDLAPSQHYSEKGAKGVVYIAFGMRSHRPFLIEEMKVGGMTSTNRDRMANVPLRDLGFPIIASGMVTDGSLLDAVSVGLGRNEIAFGKNEKNSTFVSGHGGAMDALKDLVKTKTAAEAAEQILDEDFGDATLADAKIES